MTRVGDGLWSLGRPDIAGTKQVARLFSLGGPEWLVTGLVERLVSCEYYEVHPSGRSLAKLIVDLLAACLSMRSSKPYCREGQGRAQELVSVCDGTQQPIKLRKLNSGEAVATDLGEAASQEQLVEAAHRGLFSLLAGMGMEPVLTPRLEFTIYTYSQSNYRNDYIERNMSNPPDQLSAAGGLLNHKMQDSVKVVISTTF